MSQHNTPSQQITTSTHTSAMNQSAGSIYRGSTLSPTITASSINWNYSNGVIPNYAISQHAASVICVNDSNGKELVRLNRDGTVEWREGAKIDEAAEAFGKSLKIGAEIAAGITEKVKRNIRDTVFEEMIKVAEEKGSLTPDELTFMHKAIKIMDKLQGKIDE